MGKKGKRDEGGERGGDIGGEERGIDKQREIERKWWGRVMEGGGEREEQ